MKFTIGTDSSSMEFTEDMKLIKSSLLYADEIELIGMAEYAIYNYLPKCIAKANDIDGILEILIHMGYKIGLTGATVTAFLKTADLLNQSSKEVKDKKGEIQKNVMYYYKASKKI